MGNQMFEPCKSTVIFELFCDGRQKLLCMSIEEQSNKSYTFTSVKSHFKIPGKRLRSTDTSKAESKLPWSIMDSRLPLTDRTAYGSTSSCSDYSEEDLGEYDSRVIIERRETFDQSLENFIDQIMSAKEIQAPKSMEHFFDQEDLLLDEVQEKTVILAALEEEVLGLEAARGQLEAHLDKVRE